MRNLLLGSMVLRDEILRDGLKNSVYVDRIAKETENSKYGKWAVELPLTIFYLTLPICLVVSFYEVIKLTCELGKDY